MTNTQKAELRRRTDRTMLKQGDSIVVNYGVFRNVKAVVNWVQYNGNETWIWVKDTTLPLSNVPLSWVTAI